MSVLVELLRDSFGPDLPISEGSAKRNDPLIITDVRDYVSIEHSIAQFLLSGDEWEFEGQTLHHVDEKAIDELVYAAKPPGAPDWTMTRRFFFDITAGFNRDA